MLKTARSYLHSSAVTIPERDGRTDGQTDDRNGLASTALCTASTADAL